MQTVLITGLDGSGKSTIFDRLKASGCKSFAFVEVPHINIATLPIETKEYQVAKFINRLGTEADLRQIPQLKAIALFASMLFFKKLVELNTKPEISTLFLERHPLVDTSVYARFYAEKLKPDSLPKDVINEFETTYLSELEYLNTLIPKAIFEQKVSIIESFLAFIYNWFHLQKKINYSDLKAIFNIQLPEKLFFLKADSAVLMQRISARTQREAHETQAVLEKLNATYHAVFQEISKSENIEIQIIDANSFTCLDLFAAQLLKLQNK